MSSDFSVVYASEIALPLSDVSLCCCAGGSVRRKDGGFICFVEPVGVLYIEPFFLLILNFGVKHDIYMLLFFFARRALTMRTYAGDTSLPGGRWETGDRNLEWTAVSPHLDFHRARIDFPLA